MSVLLTFAPPMSGRILNNGASFMLRRVFRVVIKRLINDDLSESDADKLIRVDGQTYRFVYHHLCSCSVWAMSRICGDALSFLQH